MGSKNTLPEGWRRVKLGEIAEILTGATPLRERMEYWNNGTIPWLTNEEVEEDKINYIRDTKEKITEVALKRTNVKLIPEDSVILSLTASVGKVAINKVKLTTNQQFNAFIVSKQRAFPLFVGYYLLFSKENIKMLAGLTTFDFIGRTTISNFQILLPPLPEQRKIAEILETIDNAIEKTDAIIEKYKRIKQGLMQDLLTRGIAESYELGVMSYELRDEKKHRFKDSLLGRIPEEWEVAELEAISFNITDGKHGDCQDEENSGYYFVSAKDIYDGKIHYENVRQITKRDFEEAHKRTKLEPFDIILTNSGTIGKIAIIKDQPETYKTTFQKSVAIIKLNTDLANPYFIAQKLESIIKKLINESYGSAQQNLLLRDLRRLLILLPPLPEQHHIASILSQIDEAIEKEQKYKEKLERIKRGLMEDLLTGKVRVNHLIEEGVELPQEA